MQGKTTLGEEREREKRRRSQEQKSIFEKVREKRGKWVLSTKVTLYLQEQSTDRNRKTLSTNPPIGLPSTHSSQDQL